MIPKSQRKILEKRRNSRNNIVRNIININFGGNNRKILNQKRVGFTPHVTNKPLVLSYIFKTLEEDPTLNNLRFYDFFEQYNGKKVYRSESTPESSTNFYYFWFDRNDGFDRYFIGESIGGTPIYENFGFGINNGYFDMRLSSNTLQQYELIPFSNNTFVVTENSDTGLPSYIIDIHLPWDNNDPNIFNYRFQRINDIWHIIDGNGFTRGKSVDVDKSHPGDVVNWVNPIDEPLDITTTRQTLDVFLNQN